MKIKHILKSKDFAEIIKSGEKVRGRTITLYVKRGGKEKEAGIGVTVPKASAPLAVKRNYVKRRIYAYFRERGFREQGLKVIVRVVSNIRDLKKKPLSKEIKNELETLAEKAGIKT